MFGNTIAGGTFNKILSSSLNGQTISGGVNNTTSNNYTTINGGRYNTAIGLQSTINGGNFNTTLGTAKDTIIGGGFSNTISGLYSGVLGGKNNKLFHNDSFIIGSGICSTSSCTTHVNCLHFSSIPTSSAGLAPGSVYSDSCVLKIV